VPPQIVVIQRFKYLFIPTFNPIFYLKQFLAFSRKNILSNPVLKGILEKTTRISLKNALQYYRKLVT